MIQSITKTIRILIVDDLDLVCKILQTSLESQLDIQIVGRACNGEIAIEKVNLLNPDIVLMDINMPVMDGLVATKEIVRSFPQTKVIIFSNGDEEYLRQEAINAGAESYIPKTAKTDEIADRIRLVYQKKCVALSKSEPTEIALQIERLQQEFKSYVWQIERKLDRVEQVEIENKKELAKLTDSNNNTSAEIINFESSLEPIIQNSSQAIKESKQNCSEISRIKILLEGQLSYVHYLNRRAEDIRRYLAIACAIGIIILILSIASLLA